MAKKGRLQRRAEVEDTWDGEAGTEVDLFHDQRDKILLDGTDSRRRDDDSEASDAEVFTVREADASESESEDDVDSDASGSADDLEIENTPKRTTKAAKKSNKLSAALSDDEDDDDDWRAIKSHAAEDAENGDELVSGWGTSARAYYNADDIDDEQDAREEEETARKLQQRTLRDMSAADFIGDYEDDLAEAVQEERDAYKITTVGAVNKETLPEQDLTGLPREARLALLKTKNPEVLPLAREYVALLPVFEELKNGGDEDVIMSPKFVALSSYLACICAYLALYCEDDIDEAALREKKVMNHLLVLRRYWQRVSRQPAVKEESHTPELVHSEEDEVDEDEVEEAASGASEAEEEVAAPVSPPRPTKRKRAESTTAPVSKSLPSAESLGLDLDITLTDLHQHLSKKHKTPRSSTMTNDFADPAALDTADRSDKQANRKSLRFYTSKISQHQRTSAAAVAKMSGDADLAYRERDKERIARMEHMARLKATRAAKPGDEDYLDDEEPAPRARRDDDEDEYSDNDFTSSNKTGGNADEDFYETVKSAQQARKASKAALKDSIKTATREGRLAELAKDESIDASGKRAVNYTILRNKGLTPKRNKDNRNGRVKRRHKYEKAIKKLSSMKQVYRQEGQGGAYSGEKTGIRKNITRSTKFSS
ncbi:Sas10 C-terminal domain-containing protein [Limtongia smithiae]|uniref:Sas10 C-terminal domain-containing protein n=1 Tax=Limtongia smithiae TaxID=1125753 RepID=UPI0034CEE107